MRATATSNLVRSSVVKVGDTSLLRPEDVIDAGSQSLHREKEDILHSWKEIAVYLRRDVRTAQRWEKQEGLPVHRHKHRKAGSIFAFKSEVGTWQKSRSLCRESHGLQSSLAGVSLANLSPDEESGAVLYQAIETVLAQLIAQAVASIAKSKVHGTRALRGNNDVVEHGSGLVDSKEKLDGKRAESYTFLSRLQ